MTVLALEQAASPLLRQEATAALPGWASGPMFVILAAVIVGRMLFVAERQLDRHVTALLFWWLCTAVLREPWLQSVLVDATPLTLSDIRLATHAAAMFGAGAIVLVVRALANVRRLPVRTIVVVYAVIAVQVVALAWIGAPARAAGMAVEELGDWRTAAYLTVYSLQMPIAIAVTLVTCVHVFYRGGQPRRTLVWASLVLVAGVVSAFDHLSRIVGGILLASGRQNAFTEWRAESNDVLFLPAVTVLAIGVGLPVLAAVRARLANDEASAAVLRLTPMWRDLSSALPSISLRVPVAALPSSAEREHRMRIECEDALYELLGHLDADALSEGVDPVRRCVAITDALERRVTGVPAAERPARTPAWSADEDELLRIADAWATRPVSAG